MNTPAAIVPQASIPPNVFDRLLNGRVAANVPGTHLLASREGVPEVTDDWTIAPT